MLTIEQVKAHSEISIKCSPPHLLSYKAKLSYLKDDKICRLSIVDNFTPPILLGEGELSEWEEDEVKSVIPVRHWEAFTHFVNESETLNEDMLLFWQEVKAYQESHTGVNLGIYKMLRYGKIEDIDVQANVRAIYDMAMEACKVF